MVYLPGWAPWPKDEAAVEVDEGDLLLVVKDHPGTTAQTLLRLDDARTFTAGGWQHRCERM
jgi:hypothetical protein